MNHVKLQHQALALHMYCYSFSKNTMNQSVDSKIEMQFFCE
jgi:hypothetical protein